MGGLLTARRKYCSASWCAPGNWTGAGLTRYDGALTPVSDGRIPRASCPYCTIWRPLWSRAPPGWQYLLDPGSVARRHFVHLVASIIEQPSLLLCAIAARQPISRYTERNFTQAQRIIRSARPTRETVYYLFPRRFLAAPSDEPPPCLRIGGIPVIRCQPVWMLSTGAASSAASVFTGQPAMPARRSDPVTVLRQLRGAGQCRLYS